MTGTSSRPPLAFVFEQGKTRGAESAARRLRKRTAGARFRRSLPLFLAVMTTPSVALRVVDAQQDVTVAAVSGEVSALARGAAEWARLRAGATLVPTHQLRTAPSSWSRLLFADGSVVVVGPDTFLQVEAVDVGAGRARVLLRLLGGEIRALASGRFRGTGRFEVETPTAVASVHGTHFILRYDAEAAETEVYCLEGEVEVLGLLGVLGRPVVLGRNMSTIVKKGAFPTAPERADEVRVAELRNRLEFAVSPDDTLLAGFSGAQMRAVQEAPAVSPAPAPGPPSHAPALPRRTRRHPISRDGEIIDQSLAEFSRTPPGQIPGGDVVVIVQPSQ